MDRQTKIAFALIFLLFIGYFLFMSQFAPPPRPPRTPADSSAAARTEAPADTAPAELPQTETAAEMPWSFQALEQPRREVVVQTPRARYHLDSKGALLTRIELLEFAGVGSEFVELIKPRETEALRGVLGLDFQGPEGWLETAQWDFAPNVDPGADTLRVGPGEKRTLVFVAADPQGARLAKSYTFAGDSYEFALEVDAELRGGLARTEGLAIDWSAGLLPTEKNRKDDINSFHNLYKVGEEQKKQSLRNFKHNNGLTSSSLRSEEGTLQWVATESKYFLAALIPDQLMSGHAVLAGDQASEILGWRAEYPLRAGGPRFKETFRVYAGPLLFHDLKVYGRGLERLVDMGTYIRPISLAIKWLMDFLSRFIPNYGLIIILLSVLTKILFYRMTHKSFKSMKEMQMLQPELKALQEKYKKDRQKLGQATMALYKERGVNPLGGCLPLLLQMPVFFALYRVLRAAVELRGAGFVLWMDDLSTMDVIYRLPFTIPILGGLIDNAISVLPILMGLSMWIQQKLGGSGMGMEGSQSAAQMAAMNKIMPIFMTFIFYKMPSGLVLYWLVNNILTVVQQYYVHKGLETPRVVPANS
jgi:YidC/Oxa1 family membrane protein insertase